MGPVTQEDPIGIGGGLNLYGYANGDPINFSDPFGLKVCASGGNQEDLAAAKDGVAEATGTNTVWDDNNCVSEYESNGSEGFGELQALFGDLVASETVYGATIVDTSPTFYSRFDPTDNTAKIRRRDIGGLSYRGGNRFACMMGGRFAGYQTMGGSLMAHELLGHGTYGASQSAAIGVENLYHAARGQTQRCGG